MLHNPYNVSNPDVMIIGDYITAQERKTGVPFDGTTGKYLLDTLRGVGFDPSSIYFEPVMEHSPPRGDMASLFVNKTDAKKLGIAEYNNCYPKPELLAGRQRIQQLIKALRPNLIISLGDVPMFSVIGERRSAVTWNGSMLEQQAANFMPVISPVTVERMYSFNPYFRHALAKASEWQKKRWREPPYRFLIEPIYNETVKALQHYLNVLEYGKDPILISCDLETRENHIACLGLGFSTIDAICIPFMQSDERVAYWEREQEAEIVILLRRILTHPRALITGQNYNYDRQYFARYWGFRSNLGVDTMTIHHTWNPDLKKGLDVLAFLYCDFYRYWKDESKDWDPKIGERQLWNYNCIDCVTTWEIANKLRKRSIATDEFYQFQQAMHEPVLDMTLRGTLCDMEVKKQMTKDVKAAMESRAQWFEEMVGYNVNSKSKKPWWQSPQQTMSLFYDVLQIPAVFNRRSGKPTRTSDDKALPTIASREPIVRKLVQTLQEFRSLAVFHNTFLTMDLDWDNRIRCQYLIDGTKTFRFASKSDAFHFGTNLQNIPKGNKML